MRHRALPRRGILVLALITLVAGPPRWAHAVFVDVEAAASGLGTAASFSGTIYHLRNNPTPPTGDTVAQANLAMSAGTPSASVLFNYDTNHDAVPGRRIAMGGTGATEADLAQYQNWRSPTLALGTNITGTVTVEFWSAMAGFADDTAGEVQVFLRAHDPLLGTLAFEIASTSVVAADWHGDNSGWVKRTASMNVSTTLVSCLVGCQLEVKLVVGPGADADMLFAYDTSTFPSRLRLP